MRVKLAAAVAAFAMVLGAGAARAETLTNDTVVMLVKAGLGSETIVAKIKASPSKFDLSTDNLIALKGQGVPDPVIAAMLDASTATTSAKALGASDSADPTAPHASGIYLMQSWVDPPRMQRMDATVADQTKTTGMFAMALTYGLAPMHIKTVLPTPSARVRSGVARPVFYFYFDQANTNLSGGQFGGAFMPMAVTSPSEFSMVRFERHDGDREVVLATMNIVGAKSGVMDKARIAFSYKDISPGAFSVSPDVDLAPGEYGFVYSATSGLAGGSIARIYDFSIPEPPLTKAAAVKHHSNFDK